MTMKATFDIVRATLFPGELCKGFAIAPRTALPTPPSGGHIEGTPYAEIQRPGQKGAIRVRLQEGCLDGLVPLQRSLCRVSCRVSGHCQRSGESAVTVERSGSCVCCNGTR